ncbi:hypothetical protein BJ878DRAFT_41355 [Calycina marina]|uniref:Uncharacterized protein n=1 Tax=Calycina marina TaxID=1763456 RepID=A0A9P8CFL8_9HELO|nr:hypothetical protein BJ878DRAFT_41355 [Calycina marina]
MGATVLNRQQPWHSSLRTMGLPIFASPTRDEVAYQDSQNEIRREYLAQPRRWPRFSQLFTDTVESPDERNQEPEDEIPQAQDTDTTRTTIPLEPFDIILHRLRDDIPQTIPREDTGQLTVAPQMRQHDDGSPMQDTDLFSPLNEVTNTQPAAVEDNPARAEFDEMTAAMSRDQMSVFLREYYIGRGPSGDRQAHQSRSSVGEVEAALESTAISLPTRVTAIPRETEAESTRNSELVAMLQERRDLGETPLVDLNGSTSRPRRLSEAVELISAVRDAQRIRRNSSGEGTTTQTALNADPTMEQSILNFLNQDEATVATNRSQLADTVQPTLVQGAAQEEQNSMSSRPEALVTRFTAGNRVRLFDVIRQTIPVEAPPMIDQRPVSARPGSHGGQRDLVPLAGWGLFELREMLRDTNSEITDRRRQLFRGFALSIRQELEGLQTLAIRIRERIMLLEEQLDMNLRSLPTPTILPSVVDRSFSPDVDRDELSAARRELIRATRAVTGMRRLLRSVGDPALNPSYLEVVYTLELTAAHRSHYSWLVRRVADIQHTQEDEAESENESVPS